MAGEEIVEIGSADLEGEVRRELDHHLGGERQRRYRGFLLAALGSVPWIGGFIAATAAFGSERDQRDINELQQEWLEEHRAKLSELAITLPKIVERLESFGDEIQRRIESEEYLALSRSNAPHIAARAGDVPKHAACIKGHTTESRIPRDLPADVSADVRRRNDDCLVKRRPGWHEYAPSPPRSSDSQSRIQSLSVNRHCA